MINKVQISGYIQEGFGDYPAINDVGNRITFKIESSSGKNHNFYIQLALFKNLEEFRACNFEEGSLFTCTDGALSVKYDKDKKTTYVSVLVNQFEVPDNVKAEEENMPYSDYFTDDETEDDLFLS